MCVENRDRLVALAREDLGRGDVRRAKDRLRSVLAIHPTFDPALNLLGHIYYYEHSDFRNASVYWSRAGRWDEAMLDSTSRVLRAGARALLREKAGVVRYYLYTFAGASPPGHVKEQIRTLQWAYYRLGNKRSKLSRLACAPVSGGCLVALLGVAAAVFGIGWAWFAWMASVAGMATVLVLLFTGWSYLHASRLYRESTAHILRWIDGTRRP